MDPTPAELPCGTASFVSSWEVKYGKPKFPKEDHVWFVFFHIYVYLSILESEMILGKNIPNWILGWSHPFKDTSGTTNAIK